VATEFQPYVGPRPFERTEADQNRFFGRDDETRELLSRITAHSAVLFYSQSGAGKTSLINAKLTPMLEKAGFQVLKPARVRDVPPAESVLHKVSNIYAFNVLRTWDDGATAAELLAGMSISEFLKARKVAVSEEEDGNPRVAIFDQFEELFTSYQERSGDREEFFDQVGAALEEDRLLRVVFAMREDYIAELDPYLPLLPEKLRPRYRIERLNEDDALLAITEPLSGTEYSFADGVAEQLVENLLMVPVETAKGVEKVRGESIEPVQLQVVCQTLWENCQQSWRTLASEKRVITHEQLETFGDVDQALSTFYETAIKRVVQATGVKEGVLRRWFEQSLITSAGTRGTVFRGQKETGDIPNAAVDELVNQHIIRGELRGGSRWYELTHDRFIAPIKASNERWLLAHSGGEQTPKRLETRAEQWARDGRQRKDLLDEGELLEAKRWLESPSASDVGYSERVVTLVEASGAARAEQESRSASRLRLLLAALVVMFFVVLGALALALWKQREVQAKSNELALKATAERELQTKLAAEEQERAQQQLRIAQHQASELGAAYKLVDQQRRLAVGESRIARANEAKAVKAEKRVRKVIEQTDSEAHSALIVALSAEQQQDQKRELEKALEVHNQLLNTYVTLGNTRKQNEVRARIVLIQNRLGRITQ